MALGYRKNVNLAQIRTFTEMDSHEEKVYEAMRKSQEKEARDEMKRRAKELQMARKEASKRGGRAGYHVGGGFGSSDYNPGPSVDMSASHQPSKPAYNPPSRPQRAGGGSALKLKKKDKDVDTFVDKLVREGERVTSVTAPRQPTVTAKTAATTPQASVHLKVTERLSLVAGRDGGLQSMELLGMAVLRITEQQFSKIRVLVDNRDQRSLQFQTHPNVDKALWNSEGQLGLKQPSKPFPLQQEVGVLKWRMQTTDESLMPLSVNCWPSENAGKCEVNIEYELLQSELELTDVIISIPCPSGVGAPVVGEVAGEYKFDSKKHVLEWRLPVIDSSSSTGMMEFTIAGMESDFFPIRVEFVSTKTYSHIEVVGVKQVEGGDPVKFSTEVLFTADRYEIV